MNSNTSVKLRAIIPAIILIIAFFVPWLNLPLGVMGNKTGYQLGGAITYLIPILSAAVIGAALLYKTKIIPFIEIAIFVFIAILAFYVFSVKGVPLKYWGWGLWGTVLPGFYYLFDAIMHLRTPALQEGTSITDTNEEVENK